MMAATARLLVADRDAVTGNLPRGILTAWQLVQELRKFVRREQVDLRLVNDTDHLCYLGLGMPQRCHVSRQYDHVREPGCKRPVDRGGHLIGRARDGDLDRDPNIAPDKGDVNAAGATEDRFLDRHPEAALLAELSSQGLQELVLLAAAARERAARVGATGALRPAMQIDPVWADPLPAAPQGPPPPPAHEPVAEAEDQPKPSPRPEPAPPPPRRAVRVEPKRGTHGPNRGGESARSWRSSGERNPTKVPFDVADFLKEEF
jgi:hypothetical protein